jgi:hypothetical protein
MPIATRFVASALLLLVAPSSMPSQYLPIPFTGERSIERTRDINTGGADVGVPCGEYFFHKKEDDHEYILFKVPVTKEEAELLMMSVVEVSKYVIEVEITDRRIPTAEFVDRRDLAPEDPKRYRVRIRISAKDYKAAVCLHP